MVVVMLATAGTAAATEPKKGSEDSAESRGDPVGADAPADGLSSPTGVSVTPGDGTLTVEWEAPEGVQSSPPTRYRVEWKPAGDDWASASSAAAPAASRAYTISGLTNDDAQDVRVAAVYGDGEYRWSEESSAAATLRRRAPANLRVKAFPGKLKLSWDTPDMSGGFAFANYRVQWKSGDQPYNDTRRELVTDSGFTIGNLDNGTVYVIRVSTMRNRKAVASSVIAAAPVTAREYIEANIIPKYEDQFPWVAQAWYNRPLPVSLGNALGLYYFTSSRVNGFSGAIRGIRYSFNQEGYRSARVVLHEVGHHFTLDHRANDANDAVGVGWLYFNHRLKGHCAVGQVYTDALTFYAMDRKLKDALFHCPQSVKQRVSESEIRGVTASVASGEIADWFYDHYGRRDGTVDLDAVWADLREANNKRTAAFQMRHMFGGYCSLQEASWALGSSGPSYGNPWVAGGCDWRKPQDVTITPDADSLTVSWHPPLYEASPVVTEYVVQWRSAQQNYSSSRQAIVPQTAELSHAIEGLTEGAEYTVRVVAANDASTGVLVDNDGHSRAAETTATPAGRPRAPTGVAAVGGNESLLVRWQPPEGGTPADRFIVRWRTGETYNSSNRVVVRDPSARSVLVTDLANHGRYHVQVIGVNAQGWGALSEEYPVMSGAPGRPTRLSAEPRPGGGFIVTWDRPDPYYPDNPWYSVVSNRGVPILDEAGHTVPQFRYDIEYKLVGDPSAKWCSKPDHYDDVDLGNRRLDLAVLRLAYVHSCDHSRLTAGESYNFRIRASYVWLRTGDTNYRNGPWAYSGPVVYELAGSRPNSPTGVAAVGGKESLRVSWQRPAGGTPHIGFAVQWRTEQGSFGGHNEIVVWKPTARSVLVKDLDSHGRYHVRVIAINLIGRSNPSAEYFVMSGAPGRPTGLNAEPRPGGGFIVTWDRPGPYYPDNPWYRVVRERERVQETLNLPFGIQIPIPGKYKYVDGDPIRDAAGHTVPRFRYDIEYRLADEPDAKWCSLAEYRDVSRGDRTLDPDVHTVDVTEYCSGAEPVSGSSYKFRIRASYVWLRTGDTNYRNGPWAASKPVVYEAR